MTELTATRPLQPNTALAVLACIALAACAPEIPVGRFACQNDADCPDGWTCERNTSGDKRCYPEGSDLNAISNRDGSIGDADAAADGGRSDKQQGASGSGGQAPKGTDPKPPAAGSNQSPAGSSGAGRGGEGGTGSPAAGSGGSAGGSPVAGSGGSTVPPPSADCKPDTADATKGVFVSPNGTTDATCGTPAQPCATIGQAINRASELARTTIYVDSGTYGEPLMMRAGLAIRGGYQRSGDAWTRDCDEKRSSRSKIQSPTEVGMWAEYAGEATVETLSISTAPEAAAGHSTYGIFARGSATQLTLRDVEVYAASGGDGQTGNSGASPAARTGTCSTPDDGADGEADGTPGAGAGAGKIDSSGYVPADGEPGAPGMPGHNGKAGGQTCKNCFESCDSASCTGVTPAGQSCGVQGLPGCGGAAAAGGGGGGGGGSSFGLFVWAARVTVVGGLFRTGNGGRGGVGGNPGEGGQGSDGSAGTDGPSCTMCIAGKITGPITPPGPSPADTQAANIGAASSGGVGSMRVVAPDGGVISPICTSGQGAGTGTAGGHGGKGRRGGPGGGGSGGSSYGVWAGGQASMNVSTSTKIQIGEAGVSRSSGAKGESMTTKVNNL